MEPGESFEAGALPELWEETGLLDVELGPCVWMRTHVFPWDGTVHKQQERIFVVRIHGAEVIRDNWTEVEREVLTEVRWWTLEEMKAAKATFAPRDLARLLPSILAGDHPSEPIAIGM